MLMFYLLKVGQKEKVMVLLMQVGLVTRTRSALQSRKWQLIDIS